MGFATELLGRAVPCAIGGLEHFVENEELIIRAGSSGLSGGEQSHSRCFGRRSNDEQLLDFGVCVTGNPSDSYVIQNMPAAALAAWQERSMPASGDGDDDGSDQSAGFRCCRIHSLYAWDTRRQRCAAARC